MPKSQLHRVQHVLLNSGITVYYLHQIILRVTTVKTATADFNSTTLTPIAADGHKDQPHNATDAEVPDGAPKRLFQRPPKPRGKLNKNVH